MGIIGGMFLTLSVQSPIRMGRIVVVVYKPFRDQEAAVLDIVRHHLPVLRGEGFVTNRKPVVMKAADGCIIEVFEWKSREAIEAAHYNPAVQELWMRAAKVCEFVKPVDIKEFHEPFSEFEAIDFEEHE